MRQHTDDLDRRVTITKESARVGSRVALDQFRTALETETKDGKTDVVTRTDRETQAAIVDRIEASFPGETVVGEENGVAGPVPEEGPAWIIDPIDGTGNFVRGNQNWAISVACVVDGRPVTATNVLPAVGDTYTITPTDVLRNDTQVSVSGRADPELASVVPTIWWHFDRRDEYVAATRAILTRFGDLRRPGSAQTALSLLASGGVDGVLTNVETNPWDTVAGVAMVRRAGGTVTDLDGNEWHHDSTGLVASNGHIHDTVLAAAREIEGETE